MTFKLIKYIFVPALILALCMQGYFYLERNFSVSEKLTGPVIGGDFHLMDQHNTLVRASDYRGKLMLVYFGFTHCPSICPTDLQTMTEVLNQLGTDANDIAPIFITLDPARDSTARMKEYLKNFHPSIHGLTGEYSYIKKAADMYKVYFSKVSMNDDPNDYMINHSAYMYLMDKKGRYITHFKHEQPVDEIVATIKEHL